MTTRGTLDWFAPRIFIAAMALALAAGCTASSSIVGAGHDASADKPAPPADAPAADFPDTGGQMGLDAPPPPDAPVVETPVADGPVTDAPPAADGPAGKVAHRVLSSVSDKGIMAIVSKDGQIEWQYNVLSIGGEANDAWMLPNGDIAFAYVRGAQQITSAKAIVWNYSAPAGTEVQSCQPLPNGNFLIGEAHAGGVGLLRELDRTGTVVSTITITMAGGFAPHDQFREVRKTPQNTYLVTYLGSNKAYEVDGTGKTLRVFPCGSFVALRLPDGNTLIACGDGHRVIEVDPQDKIVWQLTETEVPGNRLGFAAGLQRLPNGNTIVCNYPGHSGLTSQPQAFEVTRDKKLVWELSNPQLGWVSNLQVLDPDGKVDGALLR